MLTFYRQPSDLNIEILGKEAVSHKEAKPMTMKELWSIPMVPETAITVFCLKTVRYCMYMWLPMYLLQEVFILVSIAFNFFVHNCLNENLFSLNIPKPMQACSQPCSKWAA